MFPSDCRSDGARGCAATPTRASSPKRPSRRREKADEPCAFSAIASNSLCLRFNTSVRPAATNSDANRSDRRLWRLIPEKAAKRGDQLEKSFVSIEVVGCLFPSNAQNDAKRADRARSALVTMLLLRDQQRRDAKVVEENGAWRADLPQVGEEQQFPSRAYLMPDPASGRALLTVFTGGLAGGSSFDR